jgi:hypothetical protein
VLEILEKKIVREQIPSNSAEDTAKDQIKEFIIERFNFAKDPVE